MRFNLDQLSWRGAKSRGLLGSVAARAGRKRGAALVELLEHRMLMAGNFVVGPNVDASKMPGDQAEVVIAINPTNTLNVVTVSNNNRAGMFKGVSFDGGKTFASGLVADGSDGLLSACCDPSLAFDRFGNLFLSYLDAGDSNAVIAMSTDGGRTFSNVVSTPSRDQPKVSIGPGGTFGPSSIWMEYADASGTISAIGAAVKGVGQVGTFTAPEVAPGSGGGNFGKLSVGPNGQVMISYELPSGGAGPAQLFTNLDPDGLGGAGFGPANLLDNVNVGGFAPIPAQANRTIDSEVDLAYDYSTGPHRGRLYAGFTDSAAVGSGDTNIFVRFSDDDGATWSPRVQVNDDTGTNSQFFPRIKVDPTTGNLGASWYDARNDTGSGPGDTDGKPNTDIEVFATASLDGGRTFLPNVQVSAGPSNVVNLPDPNQFGDYSGLDFYNNVMRPVWADDSKTLAGNPDPTTLDIATAQVTLLGLNPTPATITTSEGSTFTGLVGSFTSSNTSALPTDFQASIDWGDGQVSDGIIAAAPAPAPPGTFTVFGTNTYAEGGSYQVTVAITGTASTTIFSSANVSDLPLTLPPESVTINAVEGQDASHVLATFTDTNPNPSFPSANKAVITWDDKTTSLGTIKFSTNGNANTFDVIGDHIFEEGTHQVSIAISDSGGATVNASATYLVSDAPLTPGAPLTVSPVEGIAFRQVIGTFTDANPSAKDSDFTALVDWGNGRVANGFVSQDPNSNVFRVFATNNYAVNGTFQISIMVKDIGGQKTPIGGTAQVADAPLTIVGGSTALSAVEGLPVQGTVATFTDANFLAQAGEFAATIDWGDGTSSTGVVSQNSDKSFVVTSPTKVYAEEGSYKYSVAIQGGIGIGGGGSKGTGGSTVTGGGTATVVDAPLTASIVQFAATEATSFTGTVATFVDQNAGAKDPAEFTAVINWGDGSPASPGQVIYSPDLKQFSVVGPSHTYGESGSQNVSVAITDAGGSSTSVTGPISVIDLVVPVVGTLSPASDSGVSSSDRITNIKTPTFSGTSEANSTVKIFAQSANQASPLVMLGQSQADANGAWSFNSGPLTDGSYAITAMAADPAGNLSSPSVSLVGSAPLVITTAPPVVSDVNFNPGANKITMTFTGVGDALVAADLANAAAYSLSQGASGRNAGGKVAIRSISVSPTSDPHSLIATILIGPRGNKTGSLTLNVTAAGVHDVAGNALDGTFNGSLPTGGGTAGSNFTAVLNPAGGASTLLPVASALDLKGAAQHELFLRRHTPGSGQAAAHTRFAQTRTARIRAAVHVKAARPLHHR